MTSFWLLELELEERALYLATMYGRMALTSEAQVAKRFPDENSALLYLAELRRINPLIAEGINKLEPRRFDFTEGDTWIKKISRSLHRLFSLSAPSVIGTR